MTDTTAPTLLALIHAVREAADTDPASNALFTAGLDTGITVAMQFIDPGYLRIIMNGAYLTDNQMDALALIRGAMVRRPELFISGVGQQMAAILKR